MDGHSNEQFTIMVKLRCIHLCWRRNGRLHRDGDRPALIWYTDDGIMLSQYWYRDDRWHREGDLPAVIKYRDGTTMSQRRHRDGEIEYSDHGVLMEQYIRNDRHYREGDGPAMIWYYESGAMVSQSYYRHGIQLKP